MHLSLFAWSIAIHMIFSSLSNLSISLQFRVPVTFQSRSFLFNEFHSQCITLLCNGDVGHYLMQSRLSHGLTPALIDSFDCIMEIGKIFNCPKISSLEVKSTWRNKQDISCCFSYWSWWNLLDWWLSHFNPSWFVLVS